MADGFFLGALTCFRTAIKPKEPKSILARVGAAIGGLVGLGIGGGTFGLLPVIGAVVGGIVWHPNAEKLGQLQDRRAAKTKLKEASQFLKTTLYTGGTLNPQVAANPAIAGEVRSFIRAVEGDARLGAALKPRHLKSMRKHLAALENHQPPVQSEQPAPQAAHHAAPPAAHHAPAAHYAPPPAAHSAAWAAAHSAPPPAAHYTQR